jgi:hypothetical protein
MFPQAIFTQSETSPNEIIVKTIFKIFINFSLSIVDHHLF